MKPFKILASKSYTMPVSSKTRGVSVVMATKPFNLVMDGQDEELEEGEALEVPKGVKLLEFTNPNTSDIWVQVRLTKLARTTQNRRTPPTSLSGDFRSLVANASDPEWKGVNTAGKRRRQMGVRNSSQTAGRYLELLNDGDPFWRLDPGESWTAETDANITVRAGSAGTIDYHHFQLFHN